MSCTRRPHPLAAARMLLSMCASKGRRGPEDHRILLMDIKKAFLYAKMNRHIYIELPSEDPMSEGGTVVGMLDKAMYGTRDAPAEWQQEMNNTMVHLGFVAVKSAPCLYFHPEKDVYVVIHVDDVMAIGPKSRLQEFQKEIENKYEVTADMVGPGGDEKKSGKFLGRLIGWESSGLTWSGDSKMAKASIEEWDMMNSKAVETPGVIEDGDLESDEPLGKEESALYRRTVARLNYASLDNPFIAFATKEASRTMSAPSVGDKVKLKRILRFLRSRHSTTYRYRWQDEQETIEGLSDSDWAGCRRTRRSTSGGVVMHGSHLIHHWSRTQAGVALSSAEAELNAMLKAGQELICIRQFLSEMLVKKRLVISGDSSAAKGILCRRGCGKVKHLEVKQLWLQEKVAGGVVKIHKIPRRQNMSDALTHHWCRPDNAHHFRGMGIEH